MTIASQPFDTTVAAQWAEADRLRVAWERAEANILHAAREVIVSKRAMGDSTAHILQRMSLEDALANLQLARQQALQSSEKWHRALDAFLSTFGEVPSVARETKATRFARRGSRRSCSARSTAR